MSFECFGFFWVSFAVSCSLLICPCFFLVSFVFFLIEKSQQADLNVIDTAVFSNLQKSYLADFRPN